jgi:hypothetical protein
MRRDFFKGGARLAAAFLAVALLSYTTELSRR